MKTTSIIAVLATAVSMASAITISLPSGVSIPSGISLPSGVTVVSAQASSTAAADGAAAGAENNKMKARAAKAFGARQNFGGQQGGQTTSTAKATATAGINVGGLNL